MLIRIWNYQTAIENVPALEKFEQNFGLPMIIGTPGCLSVELIRRIFPEVEDPNIAEYCMISRWETRELLETALASNTWKEMIKLFLSQGFGEGNGYNILYEVTA